jgi:hypothetical protein
MLFSKRQRPWPAAACALLIAMTTPVFAGGCKSTPTIPGTDIPDTEDSRAILDVLERYRIAFVERDAAGVLATADKTYADHGGTEDPSDDIVYDDLPKILGRRLAQLESIRFAIDYLEVHVSGDRAVTRVWIDSSFRLKPLLDTEGNPRTQPEYQLKQDFAEFELLRGADGAWLITRGF